MSDAIAVSKTDSHNKADSWHFAERVKKIKSVLNVWISRSWHQSLSWFYFRNLRLWVKSVKIQRKSQTKLTLTVTLTLTDTFYAEFNFTLFTRCRFITFYALRFSPTAATCIPWNSSIKQDAVGDGILRPVAATWRTWRNASFMIVAHWLCYMKTWCHDVIHKAGNSGFVDDVMTSCRPEIHNALPSEEDQATASGIPSTENLMKFGPLAHVEPS